MFQKAWATGRDFDEAAALESLQSTLQETKDKVVRLWAGVELQHQLKNVTDTHEANIAKLRGTVCNTSDAKKLVIALLKKYWDQLS